MKRIKGLLKIITVLIMPLLLISVNSVSFAANDFWLNLYAGGNGRPTAKYGYYVTTEGGGTKPVIKIIKTSGQTSNSETSIGNNKAIYCLDNSKGFGTGTSSTNSRNYTQAFDMRSSSLPSTEKGYITSSEETYKKLMWLLDNIGLPNDSEGKSLDALLSKADVDASELGNYAGTGITGSKDAIKADLVEVVQQSAIWNVLKTGSYKPVNRNGNPFKVQLSNSQNDQNDLDNYYGSITGNDPADVLYKYLLNNVLANIPSNYDYTKSGANPLTYSKGFNNDAKATVSGTNYLVGPFKIEKNNASNLTQLTVAVPQGGSLVDKNGNALSGDDDAKKVLNAIENGIEFYILMPISSATEKITFSVTPSYVERSLEYRLTATSDSPDNCQPVVVITDTPKNAPASVEIPVTPPTMDLALRKFITGVTDSTGNSKTIDNISGRTPTVNASTLEPTGTTNTTAEYKHRKDPVKVEKGDLVKYTIRVYNEGSAKGLATKIIDQLPDGLKYKSIETTNYTASPSGNQVVLTRSDDKNPLDVFTKGSTPKYEEIKITCEVTADAGSTSRILTNIAWISEEYNAATGEKFTAEGKDRDSAPATAPKYDNNWKGTVDTDKEQNEQKYYKGQEDDDDFEKLVIDPVVSNQLDLALRKYISKVENSAGQARSGSSRTLTVDETNLKNGTATTATYNLSKTPIQVEKDDFVYYNLRIFNEGAIAGRATEITDQLPTGIELVSSGTITSTNGNTYSIAYDNTNNVVTLTNSGTTNIPAYTENSLQENGNGHETITLKCKVTQDANGQNSIKLTNVAWISHQTDENDRDSSPTKHPNVNKDNISEYATNQEDDDDYEKITLQVIPPEPKQFDLALRKFISAVDGRALNTPRAPIITDSEATKLTTKTATFDNGMTAEKTHSKDAFEIKTGNIVTFTIRVYNEGEVDGSAKQITDYIPSGLEFVAGTENNNNWNYDATTRKATTKNSIALSAINEQTGTVDYKDVQIDCRVTATRVEGNNLKNIAEITQTENAENLRDRDSTNVLTDSQKSSYNPETAPRGRGYEDDDDYENLKLPDLTFDLALRKYITEINGSKVSPSREPSVDAASLKNGTSPLDSGKTATKTHTKDPLSASKGDKVKYTIKIYNEGNVNGTATKIVDYLPEGLKLAENSETNRKYGWIPDNSGKAVMTTYLSDKNISAFDGSKISSDFVEIECEVIGDGFTNRQTKNVAEIIESKNDANIATDRDSTPNNVKEKGNNYNVSTSTQGRGYEDDDDYEDLLITRFDLALRKFITGVNNEKITNREPVVDTSKMGTMGADGKEITTFTYSQTKDPVKVEQNDVVIYTLRVYNEGNVNAYAETIKDDIPEGLEFLPDHEINNAYGWTLQDESGKATTDVSKAKFVVTDFRSRSKSASENIINAFNKETMQTPDFKDVQVAFKVTQPVESDRIVINKAQISKHSDENGNTNIKDIDSTPDVWNEGEDDQDIEKIYVKYFDLALRKWVTHAIVIEDGVQKEMETGHTADDNPESVVKIEINKKRLEDTVVKFRYSIKIINEGEIAGAATEISDYIPNGLKFNQADNPKWRESNGKVITDQLKDTMLQPGEEATVDILLTWENSDSNMGVLKNVAEISADYNESGTPDIDSIPNNRKEGEDDIDEAPVALTVVAGSAPTYIAIASGITLIIGGGIFFIKKYVI